jgi:hypothetical protein
MRVCLVLEGCYPYVNGGVSSWVHNYILATKDIEYILCTIYPNRESKGKFVYDIPDNVVEIVEYFMDDFEVGESEKNIILVLISLMKLKILFMEMMLIGILFLMKLLVKNLIYVPFLRVLSI